MKGRKRSKIERFVPITRYYTTHQAPRDTTEPRISPGGLDMTARHLSRALLAAWYVLGDPFRHIFFLAFLVVFATVKHRKKKEKKNIIAALPLPLSLSPRRLVIIVVVVRGTNTSFGDAHSDGGTGPEWCPDS